MDPSSETVDDSPQSSADLDKTSSTHRTDSPSDTSEQAAGSSAELGDNVQKVIRKLFKKHGPKKSSEQEPQEEPCSCPSCKFFARQTQKASFEELYEIGSTLEGTGLNPVYPGVQKKDQMPVAIKHIPKCSDDKKLLIPDYGYLPLEAALMILANARGSCPYVLQLLDFFDTPAFHILILERPEPCQDLSSFCNDQGGFLPEDLAQTVIVQLIKALLHCMKHKVLHCDVKPDNILIRTDTHQIKLIDFGSGDLLKKSPYKDFRGAELYAPPEWFLHKEYLAEPATVWSVGVVLYEIVCGALPFQNDKEITSGNLYTHGKMSHECHQLIHWSLSFMPKHRPTLKEMLSHCWFQGPCSDAHSSS